MTGRYVEVNIDENNELIRMTCPVCKYPMRVLAKHENNVYQCYCACCQTDRYMKDTLDTEKLTFKEFDRCMKRGKGIDLERISDLVYELYNENEQLKKENDELKFDIRYFETTYEIEERGLDIVPEMCTITSSTSSRKELFKENEQLKQRINSRLHFYRGLYESTNDKVVERVIEDLEDILKR